MRPGALAALMAVTLTACSASNRIAIAPFRPKLAATLPEGVDPWWVDVSRGGSSAVWVERTERGAHLTVDGRRFGPYT